MDDGTRLLPPLGRSPFLVRSDQQEGNGGKSYQTVYPAPFNDFSVKTIPQLEHKTICASYHGWLILRDVACQGKLSLFDTLTSRILPLPRLRKYPVHELTTYTLTSSPDSDDCILFLFKKGRAFSCFPTRKKPKWCKHAIKINSCRASIACNAVLDRTIYALAYYNQETETKYTTVIMKIKDDDRNSVIIEDLHFDWPDPCIYIHTYLYSLIESCGVIYCAAAYIYSRHRSLVDVMRVYKLDIDKKSWVVVNDLQGRTFFTGYFGDISDYCSAWCWGDDDDDVAGAVRGNCVYTLADEHSVYCHSLDEDSLTLLPLPHKLPDDWYYTLLLKLYVNDRRLVSSDEKHIKEEVDILEKRVTEIELQPPTENLICELPKEIIASIVEKMHLLDYWNFRITCKAFHTAASLLKSYNKVDNLLVVYKEAARRCTLIPPSRDYNNNNLPSTILDLTHKNPFIILFSKNGCIVTKSESPTPSIRFFNLFTQTWGNYPFNESYWRINKIGFSTNPTANDCVTVDFRSVYRNMRVYSHQHGDKQWKEHEFVQMETGLRAIETPPVYCGGAFYALDRVGNLGEFKWVEGEAACWGGYKMPDTINDAAEELEWCYLAVEGDQTRLWSVFVGTDGKWVQVFEWDLTTKQWIRVQNLGQRALFVSEASSFSLVCQDPKLWNKIYFPRTKQNGVVFYCLNTNKFSVCNSNTQTQEINLDFNATSTPVQCFWI